MERTQVGTAAAGEEGETVRAGEVTDEDSGEEGTGEGGEAITGGSG